MKKIFLFLAVASTAVFTSCSSDDNSDNGGGAVAATSIVLASNVTAIEVGQSATFVVTDNLNNVVTGNSTFTANDVALTSPTFTATTAGTFTVKATYKNSKNVVLTSNPVTITVTAPAVASNSIVVGGVNYPTNSDSMLYYLGTTSNDINVFVANPYQEVGTGEAATYPNDVYVYFTSAQVDTQFIDLPTAGSYTFGTNANAMKVIDANLIVGDDEILATEVTTNASMNLTAIVGTADTTTWAFTYSVLLANNTTAVGEYHGNWNFANASQGKAAKTSAKLINKVSNAQINANLKALLASKK